MNTPLLRRRLGLGALLATLALFLAGCMKIDMNFALNEDDTADGTIIMAVSDEVAESLGQDPQAMWDSMKSDLESDLPPGATAEPYAADGYTGTKMTYTDQPISEMSTGGTDQLSITREGDEFVVGGALDMSGEEFNPDTGDATSDEMARQMMEGFEFIVSVTFPGEVTETNGEVDGTTVTWRPVMGEVNEISARGSAVGDGAAAADPDEGATDDGSSDEGTTDSSDAGTTGSSDGSGSAFPWGVAALIGGLVLLAIIGLVLWLVLRKKPDAQDGAAAFAQGAYPGQPGHAGPYPPQPGQHPGQYPPAPGAYPGAPGPQQGHHPGGPGQHPQAQGGYGQQQGQPGPYPPAPGGHPGQPGPFPGQPGQPGQPPAPAGYGQPGPYPPGPGGHPGEPGQGRYAPPSVPSAGAPAHPQQAPTTPYQQVPAPTQPLPPPPGPVPPAPTQPLPPQAGAPDPSEGTTGPGDDEIDDATRLRPPS